MKTKCLTLILLGLLVGFGLAADPPKIPEKITVKVGRLTKISADAPTTIRWINTYSDDLDMIPDSNGKSAILMSPKAGTYRIAVYTADKDGPSEPSYCVVVVGDPAPPGPDPGPGPGPNPPGPVPIPAAGLRVLVVYDAAELSKLTAGQQSAIYAKSVRDYLNSKCVVGDDGKTKEWRMWDKGVDATSESKVWQEALKRSRTSVPWVVISNGKTGYEGPLPDSADKMLELLKKYGEASSRPQLERKGK